MREPLPLAVVQEAVLEFLRNRDDAAVFGALALHRRRGQPKAGTDWRDVAMLLLAFPELKVRDGAVRARLVADPADPGALSTWDDIVAQDIRPPEEDEEDGDDDDGEGFDDGFDDGGSDHGGSDHGDA
jgi:hypothetical protein